MPLRAFFLFLTPTARQNIRCGAAQLFRLSTPSETLMAEARGDFTKILVRKKILTPEKVAEARRLQEQTETKLQDAIVKLGFASAEEVLAAIAEFHNLPLINLTDMMIPAS